MTDVNPPVRFSVSPSIMAASAELKGPYSDWGKGLMRLKAWMDGKGILAVGRPFALFYDNPTETPSAELRSEACFGVSKPFKSERTFSFKEFPECQVAETKHEGPPELYTRTYGAFLERLLNDGYLLLGPAREFFDSPSTKLGPGMGSLIQQPIRKRV